MSLIQEDAMKDKGNEGIDVGVQPNMAGDLIWGIENIAKEIGRTPRQTQHLIATKQIPAGKVGGTVVGSRERIRDHFAAILNGEAA
jgi:hypothetical protein